MSSIFKFDKFCPSILAFVLATGISQKSFADPCTYETWDWDSIQRKSVHHQKIQKSKAELSQAENASVTGCSVCEEDQVELNIKGIPKFKICRIYEKKITQALEAAKASGFSILSVSGYRVGKSKGSLNESGLRTEFSNHSYGTAIDINAEKNGLYDSCIRFGPSCRLIRGGPYQSDSVGAISKDTEIYKQLTSMGLKWGGEIPGKQKDFMHFSPSGM